MYNKLSISLLCLLAATSVNTFYQRYNNRVIGRQDKVHRKDKILQEIRLAPVKCIFNMCENVEHYPEDDIKHIIEKNDALHTYFGNIIEPANKSVSIFNRYGQSDLSPEPFCKTADVTVVPKSMIDIDNVERTIANVNRYTQVIKFQTCNFKNGKDCFGKNLLLDHETTCTQKYNIIKLVTVDMQKNTLEYRKFQIPSTCVCTYTTKLK